MVFELPSPATQMWEPFCRPRHRWMARLGPGLWFADPCSGPKRVTLKGVSRTVNLGALGHCKCRRILSSGSRSEWTRRAGEHPSSAHSPSAAAVSTQRNSSASSAFNYLQSQSEHDPEQRINVSTCVALRTQRGLCRKRSDEVGNGHSECRTVTCRSQDKHLLALAVVLTSGYRSPLKPENASDPASLGGGVWGASFLQDTDARHSTSTVRRRNSS